MITDDESEQTEPEDTDKDHYGRVRRNIVMRNLEHVAAKLACDEPRIVSVITRMSRPSLRKPTRTTT